ncbi:MAG: alpha-E domain-containing protein, partial [Thermoanaerobaculia bacterium]|nr:alpha-E domain-containing protein [Thermoanaerobaculia bacterium]
ESCFWLHRYLERMESTARFLQVNRDFLLDVPVASGERWRPLLIVAGEEPRFEEMLGAEAMDDGEVVEEYMVWSPDNPSSILASTREARENARTIREVISLEMWNQLNAHWVWLTGSGGKRLYRSQRRAFYDRCAQAAQLFRGVAHDGMLHEEPFDFMRLGMLLERAGQTARILDVKYHAVGPTRPGEPESALAYAHWSAILRSCSATESFLKRGLRVEAGTVAEFLILDRSFPRSIRHCVDRCHNFLGRIRAGGPDEVGRESWKRLLAIRGRLDDLTVEAILQAGVHRVLTEIVDALADLGAAITGDYFDPPATLAGAVHHEEPLVDG